MKGLFNEIFNILKKDSVVTKDKLLFFGPLILKYTDINSKQDFIERLIPSEMIDDEVINLIANDMVWPENTREASFIALLIGIFHFYA